MAARACADGGVSLVIARMPDGYDRGVLQRLLAVCSLKPFELEGSLCIGDMANAIANRWAFEGDPTAFEAFVNHVHLGDLWESEASSRPDLGLLDDVAGVVMASWAVSLLPFLRGRSVLFYAGGPTVEDFTVRFHVERRPGETWLDFNDFEFMQRERISVSRLDAVGLSRLTPDGQPDRPPIRDSGD